MAWESNTYGLAECCSENDIETFRSLDETFFKVLDLLPNLLFLKWLFLASKFGKINPPSYFPTSTLLLFDGCA